MKRIFLLLAVASIIAACTNSQPDKAPVTSNIFIESKVAEFVAQHPEWTSGDNTNEEITDKFQHEVKRWSNEQDFLKEMPLQLRELRDTTLNGTAFKIGTFTGFNDNMRPSGSLLNYIQVRIDGVLSSEQLSQVKIDGKYYLEGILYKQGSRRDVKLISVADFKGYDLGKYLFSLTKITPIAAKP
jgi:hypothetical protein